MNDRFDIQLEREIRRFQHPLLQFPTYNLRPITDMSDIPDIAWKLLKIHWSSILQHNKTKLMALQLVHNSFERHVRSA